MHGLVVTLPHKQFLKLKPMKTYIALLRGINVGGRNKVKMDTLKAVLEKLGLIEVTTYIQSGNVVFKSNIIDKAGLEKKIETTIESNFKFKVTVLITTKNDLSKILEASPFKNPEDIEAKQLYYALLKDKPLKINEQTLLQENYPNEQFLVTHNCVYLNCLKGAGKAKLTNNIVENKLKVSATTRNHRTILKLIKIASLREMQ